MSQMSFPGMPEPPEKFGQEDIPRYAIHRGERMKVEGRFDKDRFFLRDSKDARHIAHRSVLKFVLKKNDDEPNVFGVIHKKSDHKAEVAGAATVGTAAAFRPVHLKTNDEKSVAASGRITEGIKTSGRQTANPADLMHIRTFEGKRLKNRQSLTNMAHSMKNKGYDFTQPVNVSRAKDGSMRMGDGHHRVKAAYEAGVKEIPINIKDKPRETSTMRVPWILHRHNAKRIVKERARDHVAKPQIPGPAKSIPKVAEKLNRLSPIQEAAHTPALAAVPAAAGVGLIAYGHHKNISKIAPRMVYHGTSAKSAAKIMERGFKGSKGGELGKKPGVYVSPSKNAASWFSNFTHGDKRVKNNTNTILKDTKVLGKKPTEKDAVKAIFKPSKKRGRVVSAMAVGPAKRRGGWQDTYSPDQLIPVGADKGPKAKKFSHTTLAGHIEAHERPIRQARYTRKMNEYARASEEQGYIAKRKQSAARTREIARQSQELADLSEQAAAHHAASRNPMKMTPSQHATMKANKKVYGYHATKGWGIHNRGEPVYGVHEFRSKSKVGRFSPKSTDEGVPLRIEEFAQAGKNQPGNVHKKATLERRPVQQGPSERWNIKNEKGRVVGDIGTYPKHLGPAHFGHEDSGLRWWDHGGVGDSTVSPRYRNKGYATDARIARNKESKHKRIYSSINTTNTASIKAAEKAGGKPIRVHTRKDGVNRVVYLHKKTDNTSAETS